MSVYDEARRKGREIATNRKFAWLARFGYAARGIVYIVVGGLAVIAAVGYGGQTTDTRGAISAIGNAPWGQALLVLVGVGLVGFGLWRAVQAIGDTDGHGTDAKGMAIRIGQGVSSIMHLFLAAYAVSLAFGWGFGGGSGSNMGTGGTGGMGTGGGGSGGQSWSAWLLQWPAGQWLLAIVGLIIVGVGISQFVKAWKEKYREPLAMDWRKMRWADPVCKAGLIARGIVFGIIGVFVIVAAVQADPSETRGLGGALQTLQQQAYGQILLGVVAAGLVAFGVYSIIEAIYRRVGTQRSAI